MSQERGTNHAVLGACDNFRDKVPATLTRRNVIVNTVMTEEFIFSLIFVKSSPHIHMYNLYIL